MVKSITFMAIWPCLLLLSLLVAGEEAMPWEGRILQMPPFPVNRRHPFAIVCDADEPPRMPIKCVDLAPPP